VEAERAFSHSSAAGIFVTDLSPVPMATISHYKAYSLVTNFGDRFRRLKSSPKT